MEIITRPEALARGLSHYFTGVPCANGHLSERRVASRQCLACVRDNMEKWRSKQPDILAHRARRTALAAKYQANNPRVVTRQEAREKGLARYYTGIPCENGHFSERTTKSKRCLACHRESRAKVRAERPEAVKAQKAADYRRHREARIAKATDYQAANRERTRLRTKAYRDAHKEVIAERYKAWSKANRPLLRIHERRRRDRERGAVGSHTFTEVKALEILQGMRCANPRCGANLSTGYHQDHILPIVLGGTDDIANIQLLCSPCNLSKGDLHPDEWHKRLHC